MMIEVDVEKGRGAFELAVRFALDAPIVGLFGHSGAGKTSVVDAIAGILTPDRGRIVVDGVPLYDSARGVDVTIDRRRVGYVFQDPLLFPHLDVEANLLYGLRRRALVERIVEPSRVIELLGLRPMLRRRPMTLSGGERQRVAIGRALLAQPRILLMDEPLSALDLARKNEVLDYIERLHRELRIPIVYVSHSIAEIARLADAAALLDRGRCVAAGATGEVLGRPEVTRGVDRYEDGAVIETRVIAHDTADSLTRLAFAGGELLVPRIAAPAGAAVRTRIRARDVALSTARPEGTSVLNIIAGEVTAIDRRDGAMVDVRLGCGGAALVARITRRSLGELGIRPGQRLYALVKAVSLDDAAIGRQ
jgi:molybdate transport system ATP-binding protein